MLSVLEHSAIAPFSWPMFLFVTSIAHCFVLQFCNSPSLGFFGEVFRGIWNGTEVAIKVFLEQDLTAENMEDFCNEISILRYHIFFKLRFICF